MKVVHVETGRHLYGGAQQVMYLVQGLQERGVENTIVCPPASAIDAVAKRSGLATHNIRCAGDFDIPFMFRLRKYLEIEKPDIVHCHSRRGADFLGSRAAQRAGIPAVLSRRVDSRENKYVSRLRYAGFEKIIAISENVATSLRESFVDAARIVTIRSAVDAISVAGHGDWKERLREFGLGPEHVVAIVAAQFIERKGHRYLLRAMPDICRAHPDFRLLLFGKGPLETELREQAAQLGVQDHVQFAGFRGDADELLGAADLLIHPALYEGLGVAMLKAAAAGLPVVAFDVAGAKEAVVPDQTGLLVKPADVIGLLQAVIHLIENPSVRQKMGLAGQARMREFFSIDEMVDRHVAIYKTMTKERR